MRNNGFSHFSSVLKSALLNSPVDPGAFQCLSVESPPARDERNQVINPETFNLWIQSDLEAPVESLLRSIQGRLAKQGHKENRDMAILLLQICCALRDGRGIDPAGLGRLVEGVVDGDANQYFVTSLRFPSNWAFRLPPFALGPLDIAKIKYHSKRAGSDFADRYAESFSGLYGVWRPPIRARIIDLWSILALPWPFTLETTQESLLYRLIDRYVHLLSELYFQDFWNLFDDVQDILVSAGAPYLDQRGLRTYFTHQQFTIFLHCGPRRAGWVAPHTGGLKIDWANVHVRIPKKISELETDYSFTGFRGTECHNLLLQYAKFVTRGKRHLLEGRKDEGFLHFIIALDLALGDKQQSTAKVTKRAAALLSSHFGVTYQEQEKQVRDLYDQRSRYVHEGKPADDQNIAAIEEICSEVLKCLLRLQARKKDAAAMGTWQKDLDYIVGAIEAGRPIENQIMWDVGIDA